MKWFYGISLVLAGVLAIVPFALLPVQEIADYGDQIVLRDGYSSPIKSLDPATCGDTGSAAIQGNVFEGLYAYHYLLRPAKAVPCLAADMPELSEDRLTCTIRLQPEVTYHRNLCFGTEVHQGEPRFKTRTVTADDFILGFKRCADYHLDTPLAWAFLSERIVGLDEWREKTKQYDIGDFSRYDVPVEGLQSPDPLTLKIVLNQPYPQLVEVLALANYAPIPREAVDYWLNKNRIEIREAAECVGTGPYVMTRFERKKLIVQTRNPEYRPDFYPTEGSAEDKAAGLLDDAGKRLPFIDVLHLDFVAETYPAWMRFLTRQTDMSGIPKEAFESVITPGRELGEQWKKKGIQLLKYETPTVMYMYFNMDDRVLGASKSLRQALCLSFDAESQIEVLYNGRGVRATSFIPRSMPVWADAGPGPWYRFDPNEALEKIKDAKNELADKGLLKDGKIPTLKLNVGSTDTAAQRLGEFAKQQFSRVGVKLDVAYSDWPVLLEKVHNKTVQMHLSGWHSDYPDAENFLQLFYSPNIAKGTNSSNYKNADFDKLYEQIRVMHDSPERRKIYARMIHMVCEDCPVLTLSEPQSFLLHYDWMHNIVKPPFGYGYTKYRRIDVKRRKEVAGR